VVANIPYEQAQAAMDAAEGKAPPLLSSESETRFSTSLDANGESWDLVDTALKPLWACWRLLEKARQARDPLELDLPERRVVIDEMGHIASIAMRERLDAHRLIDDYMIAATVAAAKALEAKKAPVMYRIHEPPSREKLATLKDYLDTFDIPLALGQVITTKTFNRIIERIPGDFPARP